MKFEHIDKELGAAGVVHFIKMECKCCGWCCVRYKLVPLTEREKSEKLFKMKKNPTHRILLDDGQYSDMVVKTKKVYVSLLSKVEEVCLYFDGMTALCSIYYNKPSVCNHFQCEIKKEENEKTLRSL